MTVKPKDLEFRVKQTENGWLLMEDGYGNSNGRLWAVQPDLSDLVALIESALETPGAPGDKPLVRLKPGALKRAKQDKGARI